MSITQDELQSIINSVLSSIRTNSRSIENLTPVTSISTDDYIEINGGKKVSYSVLQTTLLGALKTTLNSLATDVSKNKLKSVEFLDSENGVKLVVSSNGDYVEAVVPLATVLSPGFIKSADLRRIGLNEHDIDNLKKKTQDCLYWNDVNKSEGIAPLNEFGKVPVENLPDGIVYATTVNELRQQISELRAILDAHDVNYAVLDVEWLKDETTGEWVKGVPTRINKPVKLRASVIFNGSIATEGLSDWTLRRSSGFASADKEWNDGVELEPDDNGYVRMIIRPEDLRDQSGTRFDLSVVMMRNRYDVYYSQVLTRQMVIEAGDLEHFIDRGLWSAGKQYCNFAFNDDRRLETSDVWYLGQRWRCVTSHVSSEETAPGFGNTLWEWIGGDPELHVGFREPISVTSIENPNVPLTVYAYYHGEDVTRFLSATDIVWRRQSWDQNGNERLALDEAWNAVNSSRGLATVFEGDDFQTQYQGYSLGLSKIIFFATVTLTDPITGQAASMEKGVFSLEF